MNVSKLIKWSKASDKRSTTSDDHGDEPEEEDENVGIVPYSTYDEDEHSMKNSNDEDRRRDQADGEAGDDTENETVSRVSGEKTEDEKASEESSNGGSHHDPSETEDDDNDEENQQDEEEIRDGAEEEEVEEG